MVKFGVIKSVSNLFHRRRSLWTISSIPKLFGIISCPTFLKFFFEIKITKTYLIRLFKNIIL